MPYAGGLKGQMRKNGLFVFVSTCTYEHGWEDPHKKGKKAVLSLIVFVNPDLNVFKFGRGLKLDMLEISRSSNRHYIMSLRM